MSPEAICEDAVLGLIVTHVEVNHWAPRKVLEALAVRDNNGSRKSCRAAPRALWKTGEI
jgi:hypothetical protein